MRKIRYQVACSLDGYIAGPDGEADWIVEDPEIDFMEIYRRFDTLLMGRHTFESMGGQPWPGFETLVFSTTLRQGDDPGVTIVADHVEETLDEVRAREGKEIWLFGGGQLFRSLLDLGAVDLIELAVIPVLLGGGIPLFPPPADRRLLSLESHRTYPSGIVLLEYSIRKE